MSERPMRKAGSVPETPWNVANVSLTSDGFQIVKHVLESSECDRVSQFVDQTNLDTAGSRKMLDYQWCVELAIQLKRHPVLRTLLPVEAVAIQCTLFEKSEAKNWLVGLHQDLSVCVAEKVPVAAWRGWSEKEGLIFVQPPRSVLADLIALRVHLDNCPVSAGALCVIPNSHEPRGDDLSVMPDTDATPVPMLRGDALVLRPLLMHASSKATVPSRRRVLHFLYAPTRVPTTAEGALSWRWSI